MNLFVFDQVFTGLVGHNYSYNRSLSQGFSAAGIPVTIYGGKSIRQDEVKDLNVISFFEKETGRKIFKGPALFTYIPNLLLGNYFMCRRLKYISSAQFEAADILYFPQLIQWHIIGIIFWYTFHLKKPRPHLFLMLRLSIKYRFSSGIFNRLFQINIPVYWAIFKLMNIMKLSKVFLLSETHILSEQLTKLASRTVHTVPLPHTYMPKEVSGREKTGRITVSFLGEDRINKGFHLLPEALKMILESRKEIDFIIQANSMSPSSRVLQIRGRIKDMESERIRMIDFPLDSDSYFSLIASSDCVLVPYDPDLYGGRSSGVVTEALSHGIPIITTHDTWTADVVRQYGCGVIMDEFTSHALVKAIEEYLSNRESIDNSAYLASFKILAEHNSTNFVHTFLTIISESANSPRGKLGT